MQLSDADLTLTSNSSKLPVHQMKLSLYNIMPLSGLAISRKRGSQGEHL